MKSRDVSLLDKMTEFAGELLFEASAHEVPFARSAIKGLAHQLGRLYGETIRSCRGHDGLRDEVTTTFMCGMALEPNFGREEPDYKRLEKLPADKKKALLEGSWEEVPDIEAKAGADGLTHWHVKTSAAAGTKAVAALDAMLRDPGGEAREEKTAGQLLYEEEARQMTGESWAELPGDTHLAWEQEVKNRAEKAQELERDARMETVAGACWKCEGTGNMGFTTYMKCDAC